MTQRPRKDRYKFKRERERERKKKGGKEGGKRKERGDKNELKF